MRTWWMPRQALFLGIFSAAISGLAATGAVGGYAIQFLPVVPVLIAGFAYGVTGLSGAALAAAILTPLLAGPAGLAIVALEIVPAWLFGRELLKARIDFTAERILWAPPGAAFTAVALYGAGFVLLGMAFSPAESMETLRQLERGLVAAMSMADPAAAQRLEQGGEGVMQGVVVLVFWLGCFLLYGLACLANFCVLAFRFSLRPSLRFAPFTPRALLLVLIGLAALAGLLGEPSGLISAFGRIVSLILLLPYFVSGLGSIHAALSRWQYGGFWQIAFYVLLYLTIWPALPIALYGIGRQVSRLTGRHLAAP